VVDCSATPDVCCGIGLQVKACYDSEVALTTFQSSIEIWVRCSIGVDDLSAGKDHLKVYDLVACPTMLRREESNSTCIQILDMVLCWGEMQRTASQEATQANNANASSHCGQVSLLGNIVYPLP
jgi:hypothetical protein